MPRTIEVRVATPVGGVRFKINMVVNDDETSDAFARRLNTEVVGYEDFYPGGYNGDGGKFEEFEDFDEFFNAFKDGEELILMCPPTANRMGVPKHPLQHIAAYCRERQPFVNWVASGVDVDISTRIWRTPLYYALENMNYKAVAVLCELGADLKKIKEPPPLHLVAGTKARSEEFSADDARAIVKILITDPAAANQIYRGTTALHIAVSSPSLNADTKRAMVEEMIMRGANLDVPNNEGRTALELADDELRKVMIDAVRARHDLEKAPDGGARDAPRPGGRR